MLKYFFFALKADQKITQQLKAQRDADRYKQIKVERLEFKISCILIKNILIFKIIN